MKTIDIIRTTTILIIGVFVLQIKDRILTAITKVA